MRALLRHVQPVVNNLTRARWLKGNVWKLLRGDALRLGTSYAYTQEVGTTTPASGQVKNTTGSTTVRLHEVDAAGVSHRYLLQRVVAGWTLTIGSQSGLVTGTPTESSGVWSIAVDAWPALTTGTKTVTLAP